MEKVSEMVSHVHGTLKLWITVIAQCLCRCFINIFSK